MKRLLVILVGCLVFLFVPGGNRQRVFEAWSQVGEIDLAPLVAWTGLDTMKEWFASLPVVIPLGAREGPADARQIHADPRVWTFADGSQIEAVLVAADRHRAQLRELESQGVGQVAMNLLSDKDRERIQQWVLSEGDGGVAGYPLPLKSHPWPAQWRASAAPTLTQTGGPNHWSSEHFDFVNEAGVKPEAMESIAMICEAVDGALSSLPLPLPVNWGRGSDERRRILIEDREMEGAGAVAGYWDGRTGIVHIFTKHLLEPDLQLVVFEFDKPEKVQKYDVIVHEVTHQSTAALIYLGAPAWVAEGIAEYLAATHFAPGVYHFANSHVPIRHHINKGLLGDRIAKERKLHLTHLESMMGRGVREWNALVAEGDFAGPLQYNQALLMIDYFFHRDHPDGAHFRRYLEALLSGAPEAEARERHLMRGRSFADLERELIELWRPLGFAIDFQDRGELRRGDVAIDWKAEEVKRAIATRRAMSKSDPPLAPLAPVGKAGAAGLPSSATSPSEAPPSAESPSSLTPSAAAP